MSVDSAPTLSAQGFLFDMDGTLIDSTLCIEKIWRNWADRQQIDFSAILKVMHGRRGEETIALVAPHLDAKAETARLIAEELQSLEGNVAIEGAKAFLEALNPEQWAVVTSAPRQLALAKLAFVGLPTPKHLIGAEDVTLGKPNPDPYLQGASLLQLPATDCIAFEDAAAGIRSAHCAGATVIAITHAAGADSTGLAQYQTCDFTRIKVDHTPSGLTVRIQA
ncbi:HAD-IA family hydrolase [uncultured Deefgea sp.]|uniref:HAD-IA family hydrolase n=1 Tax=uncultured Deefgea sp. TaxID=1304914 RepID=UPI0025943D28|nr:HAD-IA family hydrolase [uncultured Deefgea sp.]